MTSVPTPSPETTTVEDRVRAIWQERSSRPGRGAPTANFDGRRVLTLESRRAPELALLVMNYGGWPVVAPSVREVPLAANQQALTFANDVIRGRFGIVILMTGVGVRLLMRVIEPELGRERFLEALTRTKIVARGPKTVAALRELGLTAWATVPTPNTWRELLATIDGRADEAPLDRQQVALQEYGLPIRTSCRRCLPVVRTSRRCRCIDGQCRQMSSRCATPCAPSSETRLTSSS